MAKAQESKQLPALKKEYGEEVVLAVLTKMLSEFSRFTKIADGSAETLMAYSKMILTHFWTLRIDDVALILRNGLNGVYGTIYGSVDYTELTRWISEYDDRKMQFYEDKHSKHKEPYDSNREMQGQQRWDTREMINWYNEELKDNANE